jgi:hypothetical protein
VSLLDAVARVPHDELSMGPRMLTTLALLLAGCGKSPSTGAPEADASVATTPSALSTDPILDPSSAEEAAPFDHPPVPAANLPMPAREPRRASLRRLAEEPRLARHEGVLRDHFGGTLPSPLEIQTVLLPGERRAWLAYGEPRRREPFVLVTDAQGNDLWTKQRPLAGTRQIVTEMVLAPGPHGEVALLWCDIPTQIVGLRKWAADGVVLADFEVLEVDVCEALSALYWPTRGFIAVASQHGAARAQLLDERSTRAWGPKGIELGWTARPSSPATIVVDSESSAIVLQVGDLARGDTSVPDHVLAMRYDVRGAKLWDGPIDLGHTSRTGRVQAEPISDGKVRVTLGASAVTLTSAGAILGGK